MQAYIFVNTDPGSPTASTGSRRRLIDSKGVIFEYSANMKPGIALSFLGGFASGLLGIGGGVVMVPVLSLAVGFPIHLAVATSMLIMIFTSVSGAVIANRLKEKALTRIFGFIIILIGLRMIASYFLS